ncbi:MAG: polysaccharide pyruvyl transferase family protein [Bacilli bacterium]|nr:polysaccharide pyruvyl transferase family protein [Bacilli bacterium]MDD4808718.1 polysaccharide pyruvyl transferase family protein [Bacilli bacterium]
MKKLNVKKIKDMLKFVVYIIEKSYYYVVFIKINKILKKNDQKLILFNTPTHRNLGDHAITIAELKFLKDNFPNTVLIEINEKLWKYKQVKIIEKINVHDIILIQGGGYFGTLWREPLENAMNIITTFPDNPKVIMPQTFYYRESKYTTLKNDLLFITAQKKLYICAREHATYNFLIDKLKIDKEKVLLIPDIVMILDNQLSPTKRKGVLFILRSDKEKVDYGNNISNLIKQLELNGIKIKISNTKTKLFIIPFRKYYVNSKIKSFSKYQLVITDRLHGMCFAAIASTPCIAMNNLSKKVEGSFYWLKDLGYLSFSKNANIDLSFVLQAMETADNKYDNTLLIKHFDKLTILIKELLEQ